MTLASDTSAMARGDHVERERVRRLVADLLDLLFRFVPRERHPGLRAALRRFVEERE